MIIVTNEKWLQRASVPLGLSVLAVIASSRFCVAKVISNILIVICLGIFVARLVWVIRHRRLVAIRLIREDRRKAQLRERFYAILGIVWFVALFYIGRPITWQFGIVCGVAALLIAGHLVPLTKNKAEITLRPIFQLLAWHAWPLPKRTRSR